MAMKRIAAMLLTSVLLLSCVGCAQDGRKEPGAEKADLGLTAEVKPATDFTAKANAAVYDELDFDDKQEYEFATRGLIDAPETLELKDEDGTILWSQEAYAFLDDYEKAPDSVNPSLWENTKNNHAYGLFEVTDGIYQVRGYDMANLTVVKGNTGWIVFDTLMSVECSQAAMQLIEKNLGKFPVKAVIISHSHADHFGGIAGVMAKEDKADETLSIEDQLASGKIPVITPVGFTEHSVKENVYAGKGMGRRSNYQYGILLTPGVTGKLAQGIGMGQSTGTVSFMTPSYEITQSGEKLTIDGVELEFQLTPGTEAPAEMNTWLPQYKALWMAENCTGTLHNLYTLRGAEVRDGAAWASYITEAISLYGKDAEVTFQSHNWPHWNTPETPHGVEDFLRNNAAVYKYIHDRTLHLANQGRTAKEIAREVVLPEKLAKVWYTRPYYGSVEINARAVYCKYLGFYNGNPTELNALTETEEAKLFVEYVGSVEQVLHLAKQDGKNDLIQNMTPRMVLDYLGIVTDGEKLADADFRFRLQLVTNAAGEPAVWQAGEAFQVQAEFAVHVYHGTILYYEGHTEESLPLIRIAADAFPAITAKNLETLLPFVETEHLEYLQQIHDAVVDLNQHSQFALIEPNRENH